jgi:hypothetical protein
MSCLRAITTTNFLLCLFTIGCWEQRPEGFVPVTGVFQYPNGSPLTDVPAFVRFDPYDPENPDTDEPWRSGLLPGKSCRGELTPNGHFELLTLRPGDGVAVGHYKVMLLAEISASDGPIVNERYKLYENTPLTAHVKADGKNHFVFQLEK